MYSAEKILARVTERLDLPAQALGNESQVQLSGSRQVTVDCHRGIRRYSPERIEVRTKCFCVCVDGADLRVALLTRERAVIRGEIRGIALEHDQ